MPQQNRTLQLTLFALALMVSLYASIFYSKPVGADIWFHFDVVKVYLHGGNGMFASHVMEINRIPYPPLFHFLLLPSALLGIENQFARALQAFIYPGCLLATLLLIERFNGNKLNMLTAGLALLGSWSYLDATFQIRPESLDMIFWLILTYAILTAKTKLTIASVVAGIYNHGFPIIAFNGGTLLWKKAWRQILIIALLALPILAVSAFYLLGFAEKWIVTPASAQSRSFIANPLLFMFNYLGAEMIAIPIAIYAVFKWRSLNPLAKISLVTVASSLVLVPLWNDRFFQYASIPLAILVGDFAGKNHTLLRWYVVLFVAVFFVNVYVQLWNSNLNGLWDIH